MPTVAPNPTRLASDRTAVLQRESHDRIYKRTDRLFANLMVVQWLAGIAAAIWLSPKTWIGGTSFVHLHVWAAIFLGGGIASLPIFLAWKQPGRTLNRHVIAAAQMLVSTLLIHLTGGRIETHFHIFGSLAFLAFYRDWRVLVTATVVVTADHILRGSFWPQSIFGVLTPDPWRWIEHAGWVIFEDIFLFISIRQSTHEMSEVAHAGELAIIAGRLAEAQQVAHVGSWEIDLATRKVLWSDELFRLLGLTPDEGEPSDERFLGCVHSDDREAAEQFTKQVLGTAKSASIDLRVTHPNGEVRVLQRWANVHCDASGTAVRMLGTMQDVTELRQKESELLLAKSAAEDASQTKSEFLANMSHEIRTPMNGIIGMTELVLETELDREQREYLGMAKSSADALLVLINDILDFSKLEAGKLDLEAISFSLRECLGSALKSLGMGADQKGLELMADIGAGVPDHFVGDPMRLRQVIVNLTANAIKFTEQGEVVLRVAVNPDSLDSPQSTVTFSVTDTGIGIPPDKQALIFEAFSQADGSTTRTHGGTGLGLAIASQLVHQMGGRIWVESTLGKGTAFHFTAQLPVRKTPAPNVRHADPSALNGLRVLVVDDNAVNRRILRAMLANWHMQPSVVASGPAAILEMLRAAHAGTPFPLVVLDGMMPEMDGFMVVEKIREHAELSGATVMMLSSAMPGGAAARCGELGVASYLTKPVSQSELLDAILLALGETATTATIADAGPITRTEGTLRILLAEDNVINRALAAGILGKRGHSLVHAANGREAVEAATCERFDLILMDVQMPEMDGFEATARIRELETPLARHTPIMAMTAHAMAGDRERCLAAGMDEYVSKPLHKTELLALLDRLAGNRAGGHRAAGAGDSEAAPAGHRRRDALRPVIPAPPIFSREKLLGQLDDDEALMQRMIALFHENTPRLLDDIRGSIARRSSDDIARSAHALLSSLGTFGADDALRLTEQLETQATHQNYEHTERTFAALERETAEIHTALAAFAAA